MKTGEGRGGKILNTGNSLASYLSQMSLNCLQLTAPDLNNPSVSEENFSNSSLIPRDLPSKFIFKIPSN